MSGNAKFKNVYWKMSIPYQTVLNIVSLFFPMKGYTWFVVTVHTYFTLNPSEEHADENGFFEGG